MVSRYLEVFESRKAVMERARRNDGRGEEDLKDRMRRSRGGDRAGDRGGDRGGDRVRSRSRGRRERSEDRGRGRRGSFEDARGGGSSGYCVKLRGLPWETRKASSTAGKCLENNAFGIRMT